MLDCCLVALGEWPEDMFGIIRFESTIGEALGTIAVLWHDYASIHQAVIIAVLSKSLKIFLPWCWTSGLIAERASDKQTHVARSRSSRKASMEYALFLVSSRQSLTKDDRRYTAKPPARPNDETATLIRQGYALRIAANSHATKQIRQKHTNEAVGTISWAPQSDENDCRQAGIDRQYVQFRLE